MRATGPVMGTVVGTLVLAALALGGCGLPTDESIRPLDPDTLGALAETTTTSTSTTTTLPPETTTTIQPTTTTAPTTEALTVYFVDGNQLLVPVVRQVEIPATAEQATVLLQQGVLPGDAEGIRSSLPAGALLGVTVTGGKAIVSLSPSASGPLGQEQVLQFAQIVMTLTQLPGVGQVEFQLTNPDGTITAIDVPNATFTPSRSPSADDYRSLLAPDPA